MEIFNAGGQFIGSQMLKTTKKQQKKPGLWSESEYKTVYICVSRM